MAKIPSDKLFTLIQSLSPAEKRYFHIFVRGRTEKNSNYLKLYELMARSKKFSDARYKAKLYADNAVSSKKYPELKNYLYNLILQSLGAFDHNNSIDSRLNQLMQNVLVLYRRGAYEDCLDQLVKAKTLAQTYERFSVLLDVYNLEKKVAYARIDVDFLVHDLDRLQLEEKKLLRQIRNAARYRQAFYKMLAVVKREAAVRGLDRKAEVSAIVENAIFSDPDKALSHTARVYYYRTLNLYHYAMVDYDNFYISGFRLVSLLESQPYFLKDNLSDYIAALSNFILSCGLLKKYAEVRKSLEKLWEIKPITLDDAQKIRRQYFTTKFVLCIFTGAFEEGKEEMQRHLALSQKQPIEEHETASFYFQYFSICFGSEAYAEAVDWLNQWLSQPKTSDREDLQSLARILELLLHFEMGNYVLCDSILRSATRFITKKNRLYGLEQIFIKGISDTLKTVTLEGYSKDAFVEMKKDFSKIAQQAEAQVLLQTFDLAAWLESKISEKSFAEVIRQKADSTL